MSNLIKLIIGILVVVAVIVGLYFFFRDKVATAFGGVYESFLSLSSYLK